MLTDAQLATYERDGVVTIDGPFTTDELNRAEAAWDRSVEGGDRTALEDPAVLDLIQHPFLEQVAMKLLRADAVYLWWTLAFHNRPPSSPPFGDGRELWKKDCHVDIQATLEDFEATPRRMRGGLWLWLNDVPEHRGAMRILPGSHRPIMEHWSRVLKPEHKAMLPRVHGLCPAPVCETELSWPEHIPEVGQTPWVQQQPIPAVARRGQILLICSAALHAAWENRDTVSRKALLVPWIAAGVRAGLPKPQRDAVLEVLPRLKKKLRPDRAHIVPDDFDWLFQSDYEPKWPETFMPDRT